MIRTVVFWLHLSVAVVAGLVVLMMAATGVVLSLEETVTGLVERRYFAVPVAEDGRGAMARGRLAPEDIVAAVEGGGETAQADATQPFVATALMYRSDPRAPVRVEAGRERYAYVDPYTGAVRGVGPGRVEGFFEPVEGWHRWFNVSSGSVRRARALTGAANVAFLFLLLTGPVLCWPRRVSRKALADGLRLRRGAKGAARDFNWHRVVGIWSVVPLAAIAATGIATSYPSVGDRAYPLVGWAVPAGGGGVALRGAGEGGDVAGTASGGLTGVLAAAQAWDPSWRTLLLTLPRANDAEVRVELQLGRAGQPQKTGVLTVDVATGAVREWRSFAAESPARRTQQFLRYAHTGEYWGLGGRLAAGLFSLAAALMVWTGLSLAIRRLGRSLGGRRRR